VNIRLVSTAIALVASAMLLGAGVYESVVVAPNFHGAPASLQHARGFYHATNPACSSGYCLPLCNFASCWRYYAIGGRLPRPDRGWLPRWRSRL
jgi:hypothetical protein